MSLLRALLFAATVAASLMTGGPSAFAETVTVTDVLGRKVEVEARLIAMGDPRAIVTPALLDEVYGVRARVETLVGGEPYVLVEGSSRQVA
ncbi:MAG: hypothetical protein B7Z40_05580 [Bosea sp. 12-68-7]|nr:MAG: hypothetical protein B7Z40_05580 [Bosea sp. 12-68-7]OYW98322.1 MAG: hypothetical protein B7Z14_15205 [Bosea sp. 32-68-6]